MAHADDDDRIAEVLDRLDKSLGEKAHDYDISVSYDNGDLEIQIKPRDKETTQ